MSSDMLITFDTNNYINKVLSFLKKHHWLFNIPNVDLLTENILTHLPEEWINCLSLIRNEQFNDIPLGFIKDSWPSSLQDFLSQCLSLRLPSYISEFNEANSPSFGPGINAKKSYEISKLSRFIHTICQQQGIHCILDVGCGLGHLSRVLQLSYGYRILGLEKNSILVKEASRPSDQVYFKECFISNENAAEIDEIVKNYFGADNSVCLVGLHACGDLTQASCHIFKDLDIIKIMIILPCCYHKMELREENIQKYKIFNENLQNHSVNPNRDDLLTESTACLKDNLVFEQTLKRELFKYFPSSNTLKQQEKENSWFLRRPLFRLACQASPSQWARQTIEDHKSHSYSLMARACLQLYAKQVPASISRNKQKGVRRSQMNNPDSCLREISQRFILKPLNNDLKELDSNHIYVKLKELWPNFEDICNVAEIFTALQTCLQPLAEGLLFADRIAWLQTYGSIQAGAIHLLDQDKSPRALAIMALKQI